MFCYSLTRTRPQKATLGARRRELSIGREGGWREKEDCPQPTYILLGSQLNGLGGKQSPGAFSKGERAGKLGAALPFVEHAALFFVAHDSGDAPRVLPFRRDKSREGRGVVG